MQMQQVRGVATHVHHKFDGGSVFYHATEVVKWNDRQIVLDCGGWFTATTKARMNQASNEFNLGYHVYQKNGEWFVEFRGETYPFDGKLEMGRY